MKKVLLNLIDFMGKRINSPPYTLCPKLFLIKHERVYTFGEISLNSCKIRKKILNMKKTVFVLFMVMLSTLVFSQQATIDGNVCASAPDCQKYVCENSTLDLTAGITSGVVDSLVWRERVWDGVSWGAYQTVGTTTTIALPVTESATVGHAYRYQLIVYQGGTMYYALADMYVDAAPSVTLLFDYSTLCAGTTVNFTASAGGTNYDFQINSISVQSGVSNSFASSSLSDGDQVTVVITNVNSCVATSTPIVVTVHSLPSITSISYSSAYSVATAECVSEMVDVTLEGLSGSSPYIVRIYDDAGGPGSLFYTVPGTVSGPNATFSKPIYDVGSNLQYYQIEDQNGCRNFPTP